MRLRRAAALIGFCLAALFGTLLAQLIWTGLLETNLRISPAVPWAVVVMALLLWAIWRYSGGAWWPAGTRMTRRRLRRANTMSWSVFRWAMAAGLVALGGLTALWLVVVQVTGVPGNPVAHLSTYPLSTVVPALVMASLVGAVTEETGLRGYMLTRLEASMSGWIAVVVVALVISPGHGMTQGFVWPTLAWYFLADLMFGALALLTRSMLPGLVVHGIGLMVFFSVVWPATASVHPVALSRQGVPFWIDVAACALCVALSVPVFRRLALLTSPERSVRD